MGKQSVKSLIATALIGSSCWFTPLSCCNAWGHPNQHPSTSFTNIWKHSLHAYICVCHDVDRGSSVVACAHQMKHQPRCHMMCRTSRTPDQSPPVDGLGWFCMTCTYSPSMLSACCPSLGWQSLRCAPRSGSIVHRTSSRTRTKEGLGRALSVSVVYMCYGIIIYIYI